MTAASPAAPTPYFVLDSPHEVANWRPLVNWVLYIPHGIVSYVLGLATRAVFFIYRIAVLITGKPIAGLYGFLMLNERYNARANGFLLGYTERYAPFDFDTGTTDNGVYPPMRLDLPQPLPEVSRVKVLNIFLAIPHYIVVAVFAIGAVVAMIVAWFAVLFTGRWPEGLRAYMVRLSNYYYRVWTYVAMVENDYPKFGLPPA